MSDVFTDEDDDVWPNQEICTCSLDWDKCVHTCVQMDKDEVVCFCVFHCILLSLSCAYVFHILLTHLCLYSMYSFKCESYARWTGCFSLAANRVETTHGAGVSSLCIPCSGPPVVLVAGVCTDSDRLKLVCEYETPAVTPPIVPLTLVEPEPVCFHVWCS